MLAECPCPGPSQEDEYEYRCDKKGELWRKKPMTHLTVPVIFYNDTFIGGFAELSRLLHSK